MRFILTTFIFLSFGCSESGFTSANGTFGAKENKAKHGNGDDDDKNDSEFAQKGNRDGDDGDGSDGSEGTVDSDALEGDDGSEGSTDGSAKPEGLVAIEGGEKTVRADYSACAALPSAGKRAYGKCDDNSVVVIVNDGKAQEMTCCPLAGKNILSVKSGDQYIQRTGSCQADEVLTGMVDPEAPSGYCSKINNKYLKLSPPVPSQYVTGSVSGQMGLIAKSYNVSDTCICPEGTVAIGGHTAQDNKCSEQCVKIEAKK